MSSTLTRYFAIKTTVGQEKNVARLVEARLAEVYLEEVAEATGSLVINNSTWVYQIFESPRNITISTIQLNLSREGDITSPLKIEIYRIGDDEKSLSELIAETSYDPLLLDKTEPRWYEIRISKGLELQRGRLYAMLIKAPDCITGGYRLYYTENKSYREGKALITNNGGETWEETNYNILFKLKEKTDVASILILPTVKGYIFIEGKSKETIAAAIQGIRHVKNRPLITVTLDEITSRLVEKPLIEVVDVGQKVEIVSGPLRGLIGKIIRIDKSKREVTLELIESTFQLPISVSVDSIRIIDETREKIK